MELKRLTVLHVRFDEKDRWHVFYVFKLTFPFQFIWTGSTNLFIFLEFEMTVVFWSFSWYSFAVHINIIPFFYYMYIVDISIKNILVSKLSSIYTQDC